MAVDQASGLLTVREAASYLKVSPVTVKRYLKSGRLRAVHLSPRAVRIRHSELERFLAPTQTEEMGALLEERQAPPRAPSQPELARRRAMVERILDRRAQRGIAPLA